MNHILKSSSKIIVFEGLDCSFKDTNATELSKLLYRNHKPNQLYSFPSYGRPWAKGVENYLKLSKEERDKLTPFQKTKPYLDDMIHVLNYDVYFRLLRGDYIIFDRFWYSNLYYNAISDEDKISICEYIHNGYDCLRTPDVIIAMTSSFPTIEKLLREKKNKDNLEKDLKFLREVYDRYLLLENNTFGACVERVYIDDNDGNIRSREDIFDDILTILLEKNIITERMMDNV